MTSLSVSMVSVNTPNKHQGGSVINICAESQLWCIPNKNLTIFYSEMDDLSLTDSLFVHMDYSQTNVGSPMDSFWIQKCLVTDA